jgi:ubiquinone/menaquinone biosynthesis C-methylase UbiE
VLLISHIKEGQKVLNLCCGTGEMTNLLSFEKLEST